MKILKNKLVLGVVICLIALLLTFVLGPVSEIFTSKNVAVVRIKTFIPKGTQITAQDLEVVEVGKYNLPSDIITDKNLAVGMYAAFDLQGQDYMTASKLSAEIPFENAYLSTLEESKVAISVELYSSAAGLSGKLREGDIVSVFALPPSISIDNAQSVEEQYAAYLSTSTALAPQALQYMKILAVVNDVEADIETEGDSLTLEGVTGADTQSKQNIQTVILQANREQAALLAGLNGSNKLHCALVVRAGSENAAAYLQWQDEYFLQAQEQPIEQPQQTEPVQEETPSAEPETEMPQEENSDE